MIRSQCIIRRTGHVIILIGRMTLPMNGVTNHVTNGLMIFKPLMVKPLDVPACKTKYLNYLNSSIVFLLIFIGPSSIGP